MTKVRIIVRLKKGVLDPQGKTIAHILQLQNYSAIQAVHTGKFFEIEVNRELDDRLKEEIHDIAKKVLSNPLIEEYEIQWYNGTSAS